MAEGGKEVVGALDKRIADVTGVINVRGAKLAESIGAKITDIDKALGARAHGGRRQPRYPHRPLRGAAASAAPTAVTKEIEARSKAAAELLGTRAEQLSHAIKTNTTEAAQQIEQLTTASVELISSRVEQMTSAIKTNTGESERSIANLATSSVTVISSRLEQLGQAIKTNTGEAERSLTAARHQHHDRDPLERARRRAHAQRHVDRREQRAQAERQRGRAHAARRQRRGRAQLRRQGRRDRDRGEPARRRDDPILDEKSSGLLVALTAKSQEFASEVSRVTDHAVKAIEAQGLHTSPRP